MTPERWRQVEEIFQSALDLQPEARASFLVEACASDVTLLNHVEALLSQHDSAGGVLERPLYGITELNALESLIAYADPLIGRRLGAYRIEREIGRGGMGAVYEATRADNEFHKRAAIKLVKRGMDTDFILRRFRKERQILAALDHPHIAGLLDGGTTDDGLPYFVMEFIEGQPLYTYCDEHQLNITERLKLFRAVCDAVQYAHQKQVVHRDIKPSNVLVTSEGVPKLLDFGIAKLLNPDLAGDITHDPTATAMRLMTPEYASPEQVQGGPTTPSTDVYSLGVLLYELLTGHRPYRLVNRAPHEIARVICEEEPTPPSISITRSMDLLPGVYSGDDEATTLRKVYAARSTTLESLRRQLAGDLDTIVMRALRKESQWRYQSAAELRDDITRYLEGNPVSEMPDLPTTGSGPLLRSSTENALAVLPLKVLDVVPGAEPNPDYLGTGLADALITRLSAIRSFAVRPTSSVLRYGADSDPLLAARELGVTYVLEGRVRRVGDRIRVTIQLLNVRDQTSVWAGQFDEKFTDVLTLEDTISANVAQAIAPHLSADEQYRLGKRGTNDPQAHEAYLRGRYFWSTFTEEGFAKAIVCYHQAIALDPNYAVAYAGVAEYYNWIGIYGVLPFSECAAAAYEAAATSVAIDSSLAEGHGALGQAILCRDFEWTRAERESLRAIEIDPNYSSARVWYGFQLAMEGRFEEALREARIARDLDPLAANSRFCVVWCSYHARLYDEVVAICTKILEKEPHNLMIRYGLSYGLSRLGRHEEAIAHATACVESMGKASRTMARLGVAYADAGDSAAAEAVLEEMEELAKHRHISAYHKALVNSTLGKVEQALDLLEEAYQSRDAWLLWMGVDPNLDNLHGHPRFSELLRKLNHRLASLPTVAAHLQPDQESVAVLPFRVLSAAGENTGDEYLGVGLTDALVTRLSNVQRLVVRPTSSVLRYRSTGVDPIMAGRDLGVDYVVDGSLRRLATRLRVTAQLLSVGEGATRWAEQFDEESTDVLQIEDSISEKVAAALLPRLTRDEKKQLSKRRTDNSEAFESYLRGRYYWSTYSEAGFAKALESYKHAIELDPDYALAYTGIADYYNWLGVFGVRPFADCSAAAKEAASKAVSLDPGSAESYSALGFATVCADFDWAVAEGQHRRAIEINPNYATAHHWYAFHLLMEGRFDEAQSEMLRTRELDPLSPGVLQALGWCYYHSRRFNDAIAIYRSMLEAAPDFAYGLSTLSWTLRHAGDRDEAVRVAERALELSGGGQLFVTVLGAAYAAAGRNQDAHAVLNRLSQMAEHSYISPYQRALIHLHLGDRQKTLELLREAWQIKDAWVVWLGTEPQFDPLRGDPRFEEILRLTRNPVVDRKRLSIGVEPINTDYLAGHKTPVTAQIVEPAPETQSGENEEAHQLYTAGRYYAARRSADGLRMAIERFERAIDLDPNYAIALAELADCYSLLNWYVEPPPPEAWEKAKEAALRAVEADPNLAEAHAALGFVKLHYDRDWPAAETELLRAITLKPSNQVAHRWYAYTLAARGRHDEAYSEMERGRQISPQSAVIATGVANVLFLGGRFDEAIAQSRKALELDPGAVAAHTVLRWSYEQKQMYHEALATYEQERSFAGDTPTTRAKRAHVLAAVGRHDEARTILAKIIAKRKEEWVTAYEIAIIYSWLGDLDQAFEWLLQAEREHAVGFTFVRVDPNLKNLRSDRRFAELLRETDKTIP